MLLLSHAVVDGSDGGATAVSGGGDGGGGGGGGGYNVTACFDLFKSKMNVSRFSVQET